MKYAELPDGHKWNNINYKNGFKTSVCMKCKQYLYFIMNENAWYLESKTPKKFLLIDRELEIINCKEMQLQTIMDEALS